MRTYDEEGREAFRKYLQKCVSSKKLTKAEMQDMLDGIEEIYDVCKEFKDGYEVHSVIPGLGIQSVTGGTPFYNDGSANCDCYYQSGGSGYFTS